VRKLGVWLPPQYDEGSKRRFPVLYDLVGFTGSGLAHANWRPFGDNVRSARRGLSAREKWDRRFSSAGLLHGARRQPVRELLRDRRLRGLSHARNRSLRRPRVQDARRPRAPRCFGKSSGGYGSILHGMKYAKTWGAIADHSGDAYFDFVYWHDWRTR